jgi:hypothetical protein
MSAAMIGSMGSILDDLTFDPEIRGWDNIRAWYRGSYAGCVHAARDRKRGWWAGIYCGPRELNLGLFSTRDEGKQAIIDWFRGLEIEEWLAQDRLACLCP